MGTTEISARGRRIAWFIAIYVASLGVMAAIVYALRLAIRL